MMWMIEQAVEMMGVWGPIGGFIVGCLFVVCLLLLWRLVFRHWKTVIVLGAVSAIVASAVAFLGGL